MFYIKCNDLTDIQMHLTPQQVKTHFRVNASHVKEKVESKGDTLRCDVVEISEAGRELAKASEVLCPAKSPPLPCGYTYLRRSALIYNLLG